VLKKSKIETKNKIITVVLEKDVFSSNLIDIEKDIKKNKDMVHIIESTNAITVITSEDYLDLIEKILRTKSLKQPRTLLK